MNILNIAIIIMTSVITGCAGGQGPGYFFHVIFIILPLVLIGHYLYKRLESSSESLYVMEGQIKRIIGKLDKLESQIRNIEPDSGTDDESASKKQENK